MDRKYNPIIYSIYQFLKGIVLLGYRIFYAKVTVINEERLKFRNPAILVSNHPNTMSDPLNVAAHTRKLVAFLANASLYENPIISAILKNYTVPIERPQDVDGRRIQNDSNFEKCNQFLEEGGVLWVAPQGGSKIIWRIGKIKTGAARIALSTESKKNFDLDLIIVPIGLTYNAPSTFRSQLLVQAGEPISVSTYKKLYESDPKDAARKLTALIKERLGELVIDSEEEADEKLIRQVVQIQQSEQPLKMKAAFDRAKNFALRLAEYKLKRPVAYEVLQKQCDTYFSNLEKSEATENSFYAYSKNKIISFVGLLIGFPVFLVGIINHALANGIPWLIWKKIRIYEGYHTPIKILSGVLTYPIFYGLQFGLVKQWTGSWMVAFLYLIILYPLGLFTVNWYRKWQAWKRQRKVARFEKEDPNAFKQLIEDRKKIQEAVEQIGKQAL